MKIVKNDVKIVCEVKGCKNLAEYKLIMDLGEHDEIRLCKNCLKDFYNAAAESIKTEENCSENKGKRNKRK